MVSVLPPFLDASAGAMIGVASVLLSLLDTSAVTTIGVSSVLLLLPGCERRGDDQCGLRDPPPSWTRAP